MHQTTIVLDSPSLDLPCDITDAQGHGEFGGIVDVKGDLVGNEAATCVAAKKTEFMESLGALVILGTINALAFETRMNEKAYMLHKEAKHFHAILKSTTALLICYEELERLRPDACEQKQIDDARKATQEYQEAAEKWVDAQKATGSDEKTMNDQGEIVENETSSYLASKKAEYMEVRKGLVTVITINKLIAGIRLSERSCKLDKVQDYLECLEEQICRLLRCYDGLETLRPDTAEQEQIADARRVTNEYIEALRAWATEYRRASRSDKLTELARTMDESGATAGEYAAEYLAAKQIKADLMADTVFIAADIAETALKVRLNAQVYILNQDEGQWKSLNDNISRLPHLYEKLRRISFTKEDRDHIDRVARATKEYLAAAQSWVGTNKQMKAAERTMDNCGEVVGDAAVGYQGNKQSAVDRMANVIFEAILVESAALETRNITLRERLKELDCLYHVTGAIATCAFSVPSLLEAVVHRIPVAFLHPECCGARLTVHDVSCHTDKFIVSSWRLLESIRADGHIVGCIEVSYSQGPGEGLDDLFLPEEHRLIQALAQRLGKAVEHIQAQTALLAERTALADKNTALREVISLARKDKEDLASQIVTNVNKIIMPIVQSLESALPSTLRGYAGLLRRNLEDIASPLVSRISLAHEALTPAELQICDLIGQGLTAKEIAQIRSISPVTVLRHRQSIRKKLGITNKQVNLASYLCTFGNKQPNAMGDE